MNRSRIHPLSSFLLMFWCGLFLFCHGAGAAGFVRISLKETHDAWVGQRVVFFIHLLSPTHFSGTPRFELPTVRGGLLMKLEDRPVILSEVIEGETYSVQRHEFAFIPWSVEANRIPPIDVEFTVAGVGDVQGGPVRSPTPPLSINIKQPPGTGNIDFLISSKSFQVKETWEPQPEGDPHQAIVGDAFIRTLRLTSSDIPAMAFPPVVPQSIPGMGIYPDKPRVVDKVSRGEFSGERIDSITYVCESPGQITLPEIKFHWWDLKTETLKSIHFPTVHLDITPDPNAPAESEMMESNMTTATWMKWLVPLGLVIVVCGGWALWIWRTKGSRRSVSVKAQDQEPARFEAFKKACHTNDMGQAYQAYWNWKQEFRHHPVIESTKLRTALEHLQRQLIEGRERSWEGHDLFRMGDELRRELRTKQHDQRSHLPALNPEA